MSDNLWQIICEIDDRTFDPSYQMGDTKTYATRKAARGVLYKGDKIALLHVTKKHYHKLPGGGVKEGETKEEAFRRELLEETGCKCEIKDKDPIVFEYRDKHKLMQVSYVFLAEALGKEGKNALEQDEVDEGFKLEWVPLEKAEEVWMNEQPEEYEAKFIKLRDWEIFKYFKTKLQQKG